MIVMPPTEPSLIVQGRTSQRRHCLPPSGRSNTSSSELRSRQQELCGGPLASDRELEETGRNGSGRYPHRGRGVPTQRRLQARCTMLQSSTSMATGACSTNCRQRTESQGFFPRGDAADDTIHADYLPVFVSDRRDRQRNIDRTLFLIQSDGHIGDEPLAGFDSSPECDLPHPAGRWG